MKERWKLLTRDQKPQTRNRYPGYLPGRARAPLRRTLRMDGASITIVSGLPRSGTSMMMQAVSAGGLPVLTDHARLADEDNPRGYLEFAPAKTIAQDQSWLPQAQGKSVKLVSALLRHLPPEYRYTIIFMQRDMAEVLASQQAMLQRQGTTTDSDDARLAVLFEQHLADVAAWLAHQPNMEVLYVQYRDVVSDPATQLARVRAFLRWDLRLDAMVSVIDSRLHRQRSRQIGMGAWHPR
jgi:hypothetical protein